MDQPAQGQGCAGKALCYMRRSGSFWANKRDSSLRSRKKGIAVGLRHWLVTDLSGCKSNSEIKMRFNAFRVIPTRQGFSVARSSC